MDEWWVELLVYKRGRLPVNSLHRALELRLVPDEYLEQAQRIVAAYDDRVRRPTWGVSRSRNNNDPAWDNVVRAMEEDR